jgi:hypothetical protein
VPVFWRGDPLAGSGKCIRTGLTIPLLQCTRTSEVVRRRGDHPTKTGGRPNPKTGRRPSHVRRDNGTSLRQNRKRSFGYSLPHTMQFRSQGNRPRRFCIKAIRRTRVKLRFVSPCLCGLFNKEDSEAGAHRAFNKRTPIGTQRFQLQRQSVHLKRAELRMVLK